MGYEYDVFLSYTHAFPFGKWVHEHFLPFFEPYLENALNRPVSLFTDRENILGGETWPLKFQVGLARARCMVAIWSPSYFFSKWCRRELAVILKRERELGYRTPPRPGGLVLPVLVTDGHHLPEAVKGIQYFDCRSYARIGPALEAAPRYIEFQDKILDWTEKSVAAAILAAPQWKAEWEQAGWNDQLDGIPAPAEPVIPLPAIG